MQQKETHPRSRARSGEARARRLALTIETGVLGALPRPGVRGRRPGRTPTAARQGGDHERGRVLVNLLTLLNASSVGEGLLHLRQSVTSGAIFSRLFAVNFRRLCNRSIPARFSALAAALFSRAPHPPFVRLILPRARLCGSRSRVGYPLLPTQTSILSQAVWKPAYKCSPCKKNRN